MYSKKPCQIPEDLIRRFDEKDLIIFVGSGVSKLCGLPSWKGLANDLIDNIFKDGKISYDVSESLKKESPLKALSVCESIINQDEYFKEYIKKCFGGKGEQGRNIHEAIKKFACGCITTNYDTLLEQNGMLKREINFDSFIKDPIGKVFYLHGRADDNLDKIIITLKSYCIHYAEQGLGREFLKTLFSEKSILFIGFGLEEFEIVEHIHVSKKDSRHYALIPMRAHEEDLIKEYKKYYDAMNIELIDYNISTNGYAELENVLLGWSEQIEAKRNLVSDEQEKSENLLNDINLIDEAIKQ